MEDVTITITKEKIHLAVAAAFDTVLKQSYANPVKDCIEKALKENDGVINKFVNEVIAEQLNNHEFKTQLGGKLMERMVQMAMNK